MEKEEIEIDLRAIYFCLRANILVIILSTLIGGMLMYYVSSNFMDKKFVSSTKFYVLNQQDEQTVTYSDLQTGSQLTKDYAELVTSRTVMMQVIAELNLQGQYEDMKEITPDELAEMVTVEAKQDTRIVEIKVTDVNPTRAQDIANAVRKASAEHIYDVMDIEAVNVVDCANLPEKPVSPNTLKLSIIGAIICLIVSSGIIVVTYLMDDTIKTPDDVEQYLGISVLASIPYDDTMEELGKRARKKNKRHDKKKIVKGKVPTIK